MKRMLKKTKKLINRQKIYNSLKMQQIKKFKKRDNQKKN